MAILWTHRGTYSFDIAGLIGYRIVTLVQCKVHLSGGQVVAAG